MITPPLPLSASDQWKFDDAAPGRLPAAISRLAELGAIQLGGDDAVSFLQGQFTNDVTALQPGEIQPGAYCNPKGRIIADFYLARSRITDSYFLIASSDLLDGLSKRLQLYRMRAKVSIDTVAQGQLYGIVGVEPQEIFSALHDAGGDVEGWTLDAQRSLLLQHTEQPNALVAEMLDQWPLFDDSLWKLAAILAGEPRVYAATSEEFIPQQINLDLVNGVSFSKGCYPGQEIIARIRYLGKLKQRMIAATVQGDLPTPEQPTPGTPLFTSDRPNQKSGIVVDAVALRADNPGNGLWLISAMVAADYITEGTVMLGSSEGLCLKRIPLPYAVTTGKR